MAPLALCLFHSGCGPHLRLDRQFRRCSLRSPGKISGTRWWNHLVACDSTRLHPLADPVRCASQYDISRADRVRTRQSRRHVDQVHHGVRGRDSRGRARVRVCVEGCRTTIHRHPAGETQGSLGCIAVDVDCVPLKSVAYPGPRQYFHLSAQAHRH